MVKKLLKAVTINDKLRTVNMIFDDRYLKMCEMAEIIGISEENVHEDIIKLWKTLYKVDDVIVESWWETNQDVIFLAIFGHFKWYRYNRSYALICYNGWNMSRILYA